MLLKFAYTWRGLLVGHPVILAVVCFWYEYENDGLVWPLGLLLFLGGWAVRIWAQQHVGYRLKSPRALTTSGPYALVRNPIYIGNTLIVLGVIVLSELVWLVPLTVLWCTGVYAVVIRYEERQLLARYGAPYRAYQTAVPRWRPGWRPGWVAGRRRANLLQALRVECHVVLMVAPAVLKEVLLARFMEQEHLGGTRLRLAWKPTLVDARSTDTCVQSDGDGSWMKSQEMSFVPWWMGW